MIPGDPLRFLGIAQDNPYATSDSPAAPLGIFYLSFYLSYGGRPVHLDKPLWMSCFTKKKAAYCPSPDIRNIIAFQIIAIHRGYL